MRKVRDFSIFQKNIILYCMQFKKVCGQIFILSVLHIIYLVKRFPLLRKFGKQHCYHPLRWNMDGLVLQYCSYLWIDDLLLEERMHAAYQVWLSTDRQHNSYFDSSQPFDGNTYRMHYYGYFS